MNTVVDEFPGTAPQMTAALAEDGVDAFTLVENWSQIEPSRRTFEWDAVKAPDARHFDQWVKQAVAAGRKINLAIRAGEDTPCWMFDLASHPCGSGYVGSYAGARELTFEAASHQGLTAHPCETVRMAAPWDPIFLREWDAMLAGVAAHLRAIGAYGSVALVPANTCTNDVDLDTANSQLHTMLFSLLALSDATSGGRLAVEFENLDNAEPASPTVVEANDELHAGMGFMTNNFLAAVVDSDPTNNVGAACSGGFGDKATACASWHSSRSASIRAATRRLTRSAGQTRSRPRSSRSSRPTSCNFRPRFVTRTPSCWRRRSRRRPRAGPIIAPSDEPPTMALSPGTRLGAYEILAAIGVGGMGEVYRARDTKLGREVAVKVILQEFAADRERIARLEREAKALAALNHPAIATLLGLEHADGRDFLLMELVPGDTLRERLARGPMPVETTMLIARQIAEALEAAHEKGIVHRDLKPANVKVSDDDRVKLLDFGLARAVEPPSSSSSASFANSPTVSAMTQQGVILGTASYMSPEQARGLPADHRSDIFSFGVVLYEMLAGRQPFQGETVSDVLASVLAREPDLRALPSDLHPRLTDLVRRCLEKPPRKRWQAIGDVRHELESIAANPQSLVSAGPAIAPSARPWWKRALPAALAALLTAAVVGGITWRLWPVTEPSLVSRFDVPFSEGQVLTAEMGRAVAVSPDGSLFAYSANRQIFLRGANQTSIRRLFDNPGFPFISNLTFSPDGKQLVFWSSERNIQRLSVTAGAPVKVCDIAATVTGFSWVGDDLWFSTTDGIMRVPAAGGTPVAVIKKEGDETFSGMTLLPDHRHVLFTVAVGDAPDRWEHARVVVQPIDGGQRAVLVEPGFDGRYLPGGYLLYSLGGVTFAVRFDASRPRVSGAPVAVIEGVRRGGSLIGLGSAQYSVSNAGTLVYVPGPVAATTSPQLYLAFFDPAGTAQPLKIPAGTYTHPRLSPNGHLVAYGVDDGRELSVWIADVAGVTGPRRLSIGGKDRYPVWADNTRVIFQSDRGGDLGLFMQRADGSGTATRLTTASAGVSHIAQAVSPDGQVLLIDVVDKDKTALVEYRFSDQTLKSLAGITSLSSSTSASFSPDGKWLAYTTAQATGGAKVFVQPYPATGAVFQISKSNEDGHHSAWSSDGSRLFYTPGPGAVLVSAKLARAAGIEILETTLVARPFTNGPPSIERPFDTSPGVPNILGLTATLSAQPGAATVSSMSVVLNWLEEVKQKVK